MIVIVMGVTGSGKTTIGEALAARMHCAYAEGDAYHSEANKQKMHAGIPLDDADRAPWLASLHHVLIGWHQAGQSGVLACSALKAAYREILTASLPPAGYRFVLLHAPPDVIRARLEKRSGHYMNPALLQSQFDTLEVPADALRVSIEQPPGAIVDQILRELPTGPTTQTS